MAGPAAPTARYLVLNRFDDEFGAYHRYVDTTRYALAYLTLADCADVLDRDNALDTVVVPDLAFETLLPEARRLHERHGFDGIVGLSEYDLLTTALLRAELGVSGWSPDFVRDFRDKPRMKQRVRAAGLRVPRFLELDAGTGADRIIDQIGLAVVLKPRAGAASQGVALATGRNELARALASVDPAEYQCEEFVAGSILHVDGVRRAGGFHFVSASLYVNTCLAFAAGEPLGSVLLDDGPLRRRVVEFSAACLDALNLSDGAFHLELLHSASTDELVFMEVGLRPGGAEIPLLHRDLFGVDLMGEAFRATLGLPPVDDPADFRTAPGGGWVLIPEPRPFPSRVLSRTPLVGKLPEVYAETVPEVGEVFDGHGGYLHIGGSFRLRGPGQAAVHRAVLDVIDRYELIAEPAHDHD